ncbi:MAG: CsbD family protein [Candidatus Dormibacteraeota bacterium]|uniref:CsbD family protein n=1 Tax=Candidatus Amunia macphersoniae TaxID=3127014 RepID=A0A934NGC8_9BACT|nr:CsbD family protein [Candidatus Dormibacteraeota bacterium]
MGGEGDKAAGRVKEAAGDLTGDKDLQGEGKTQNAAGNVKDAGSKVGDKVKDAADNLGDSLKK